MDHPILISDPSYKLTVIHSFPLPITKSTKVKQNIFLPKKTKKPNSVIPSHPTNTLRFNEYTLYL